MITTKLLEVLIIQKENQMRNFLESINILKGVMNHFFSYLVNPANFFDYLFNSNV